MSLLLYVAVLLVSVSSVLFGLGWLSGPEPQYKEPPPLVAIQAPAANNRDASAPLSPVYPTAPAKAATAPPAPPTTAAKQEAQQHAPAPDAAPSEKSVAAAPAHHPASAPVQPAAPTPTAPAAPTLAGEAQPTAPAADQAQAAAAPPMGVDEGQSAPSPAAAPPGCNVDACAAAYRSFRASDCTYQTFAGQRRMCTKGGSKPNAAVVPASEARAEALGAKSNCNVRACERAYTTFNPADCTYQPIGGPRRICAK